MKSFTKVLLAAAGLLLLIGPALADGDKPVKDEDLGLAKNSVFDTPKPIVAPPAGGEPGENALVVPYAEGVPPTIPHEISEFLPIRIDENACIECHVDPSLIGEPVEEGDPTPAPASHFTDLRRDADTVTGELIGARFNCTQCHVPQTAALPLVDNSVH